MIRIGLVDDDLEHLRLMREFLSRYECEEDTAFQVEEFHDGLSFTEDYNGQLDIVFLDIEMPHMDGMTAARRIRERDDALSIVFLTYMAQYAIHGYEVNAIDFYGQAGWVFPFCGQAAQGAAVCTSKCPENPCSPDR